MWYLYWYGYRVLNHSICVNHFVYNPPKAFLEYPGLVCLVWILLFKLLSAPLWLITYKFFGFSKLRPFNDAKLFAKDKDGEVYKKLISTFSRIPFPFWIKYIITSVSFGFWTWKFVCEHLNALMWSLTGILGLRK